MGAGLWIRPHPWRKSPEFTLALVDAWRPTEERESTMHCQTPMGGSRAMRILALLCLGSAASGEALSAVRPPQPSAGCGKPTPSAAGQSIHHTIVVPEPAVAGGSHARRFLLRVPAGYQTTVPQPLLMDVHGYTSFSEKQHNHSGFSEIADKHGFIGVWPVCA